MKIAILSLIALYILSLTVRALHNPEVRELKEITRRFDKNMKKYRRKSYYIVAERATPETKIYNHLTGKWLIATTEKNIILTGTWGEKYLLSETELTNNYTLQDKTKFKDEIFKVKPKRDYVYAQKSKAGDRYYLHNNDGEVIGVNEKGYPHGDGDYIVRPVKKTKEDDSYYVINGLVFPEMYEEVSSTIEEKEKNNDS